MKRRQSHGLLVDPPTRNLMKTAGGVGGGGGGGGPYRVYLSHTMPPTVYASSDGELCHC